MTTQPRITLRAIYDIERICECSVELPIHDERDCWLLADVLPGTLLRRCSICDLPISSPAPSIHSCLNARANTYVRMRTPGPEFRIIRKKAQS